jgi:hypothetical protein
MAASIEEIVIQPLEGPVREGKTDPSAFEVVAHVRVGRTRVEFAWRIGDGEPLMAHLVNVETLVRRRALEALGNELTDR